MREMLKMSRDSEDKIMSDVVSIGSIVGPERNVPERTPMSGSAPTLLHARLVLPCPSYTPYGARGPDVKIGTNTLVSRVMW